MNSNELHFKRDPTTILPQNQAKVTWICFNRFVCTETVKRVTHDLIEPVRCRIQSHEGLRDDKRNQRYRFPGNAIPGRLTPELSTKNEERLSSKPIRVLAAGNRSQSEKHIHVNRLVNEPHRSVGKPNLGNPPARSHCQEIDKNCCSCRRGLAAGSTDLCRTNLPRLLPPNYHDSTKNIPGSCHRSNVKRCSSPMMIVWLVPSYAIR